MPPTRDRPASETLPQHPVPRLGRRLSPRLDGSACPLVDAPLPGSAAAVVPSPRPLSCSDWPRAAG
ncbi:hypothetical protein DZF97_15775, partial [Clavibacter nebraskensis]